MTRGSKLGAVLLAGAALLCGAGPALAQSPAANGDGFNAQNFKPALDPYGYVQTEGARSLQMFQPFVGLYFNWAHNPLKLSAARPGGFGNDVIRDLSQFNLVAALGLLNIGKHGGVELAVDVPYVVDENGIGPSDAIVFGADGKPTGLRDAGFGSLRTALKVTFLDREDDAIGISGIADLEWPTGKNEDYLANSNQVSPRFWLVLEKKFGPIRFGVNVGYEWIYSHIEVGGVNVDDKIWLRAGLAIEPFDMKNLPLSIVIEGTHWFRAGHPWDIEAEAPIEVGGAIKYSGTLFALVGAYAGLNEGVGSPDERVVAALGVAF
jgi:hypothetical protein